MSFRDYILAPLESNDRRLGIRPLMAIAALAGMIKYVETHVAPDSGVMNSFIALITLLLGLSTAQNIADKAIDSKNQTPPAQ